MIPLDTDQVMRATGANRENAERFLPFIQGTCKAYEITSPKRIAGFLSQVGHESAGLSRMEENLNYSVQGLKDTFSRARIGEADCEQYGRRKGQAANQEQIANIVYGGVWGKRHLGNEYPGDGYRFRGRGLIQITGRRNYERCGHAIGESLVIWPERLLEPVNAALSAGWYWQTTGCNEIADRADVKGMTIRVNGGTNGLDERVALWHTALEVLA